MAVEADLNQVLEVLEQLSPQELAVVQERLAARKEVTEPAPGPSTDVFDLPFDDYLALSDEEREAVQLRAYQTHQARIDAELERQGAEWLLVCGGEVVETSPALRDYPSREKLMQIGQQRGRVPFVFVREPLVEESAWSALAGNDFYPTVRLTVAAPGTGTENLPTAGVGLTADFDSGSPNLFVDYDQMLALNIIDRQPIDQAHFRPHLGQLYRFYVLSVLVGITDEQGGVAAREVPALCVTDWRQSPLCRVNPNREALAERNLLLEFPLRMELNGVGRVTHILEVPH
jgi:hypothetical protein